VPPRRAAVAGQPIAHSLSPVLHRAAYAALGLDWRYTALECDAAGLPAVLDRVRCEPEWAGLSLTMPLKTAVLGLLDEVDPLARTLGAVNTVSRRPAGDGRLAGFNTDVEGIAYAVGQVRGGALPERAVILGAGGTARAAIGALGRLGVARADVIARRPPAAAPLVALGEAVGVTVTVRPWESSVLAGADLVVATAPAGATDGLAREPWPADRGLVELLYHPWPTALAAAALAAGAPVAGGMVVLAAQAVGQVRLFAGTEVDAERLLETLLAAGTSALADRARPGPASGPARPGTARPAPVRSGPV
jgi:shikimate dehydrogenase